MHRKLMCFAFMLAALAALALTGCSSDKRDNGGSSSEPATVTFKMFLEKQSAKAVVYEVESFKFTGFTDAEGETPCSHGAWSVAKDDSKLGAYQEVVFNDVPKNVVRFDIDYLDAEGNVFEVNRAISVNLASGSAEITIDEENNPPQEVCQISVKFAEGFEAPADAATYTVFVENDAAVIYAKTYDTIESPLPEASFDLVPISATQVRVIWFDAEGAELSSNVEALPENLQAGVTYPVTISGETPSANYSVLVKNVYQAEVADASKVSVSVIYASDYFESDSAEGQNVVYNKDDKTCSFDFDAIGDNAKVLSVTIADANFESPMAFEWLTYADGLALTAGTNELDVNDNEFAGGEGTSEKPYQVGNPRQLDNVRNYLDKSFEQCANIDFAGSCGIENKCDETGSYAPQTISESARFYNDKTGFAPIGTAEYDVSTSSFNTDKAFKGAFNGNEREITGLVQYGEQFLGLFGATHNAIFESVVLGADCSCCAPGSDTAIAIGSLIGAALDNITLEACKSSSLVSGYSAVGGQIGYIFANTDVELAVSITDCEFTGSVQAAGDYIGGIVGYNLNSTNSDNSLSFKGCTNSGEITGNSDVAGILGYSAKQNGKEKSTFANCTNEGQINGDDGVGGISAHLLSDDISVSGCVNKASINGNQCVAGIFANFIGYEAIVSGCENSGDISTTSEDAELFHFGGIVALCDVTKSFEVSNCVNEGTIKVWKNGRYIGGILGRYYSDTDGSSVTLNQCQSYGNINSGDSYCGGLAGEVRGPAGRVNSVSTEVRDCEFKATITLTTADSENGNVGGMLGFVQDIGGLKFTGDNKVLGKLTYDTEEEDCQCYGGAIGGADSAGVEDVKTALNSAISVDSNFIVSNKDKCIGLYCGNPYVDTLE